MSGYPNGSYGTHPPTVTMQNGDASGTTTSFTRPKTACDYILFLAIVLALIIVIPVAVVLTVSINIASTVFSAIWFEALGHYLLRAYGVEGFDSRVLGSVKLAAVGGAIIAIPYGLWRSVLNSLVESPIETTSIEAGTLPLLPQPERPRRQSSMYDTVRNHTKSYTKPSPIIMSVIPPAQGAQGPSRARVWTAVTLDLLTEPLFGAAAGAIGSAVLTKAGYVVLSVEHAAWAGGVGGLVIGPVLFVVLGGTYFIWRMIWVNFSSSRP